jgi:hypothetical protein
MQLSKYITREERDFPYIADVVEQEPEGFLLK